jgi:hypothetical protein
VAGHGGHRRAGAGDIACQVVGAAITQNLSAVAAAGQPGGGETRWTQIGVVVKGLAGQARGRGNRAVELRDAAQLRELILR